jgi:ATP-binding cassette subfamily G (WHITE) protein 2 (PDR)
MIVDLPYKITNSIVVNSTLYFMANLRREPGPFFFFMLIAFTMTLSMSMFFRLFASMTKTIEQALAPSSIILLIMVMYTGFAIPVDYMKRYVYLHLKFIMLTVIAGRVGFDGSTQSLMALKA